MERYNFNLDSLTFITSQVVWLVSLVNCCIVFDLRPFLLFQPGWQHAKEKEVLARYIPYRERVSVGIYLGANISHSPFLYILISCAELEQIY